jgi:hypothetical protein
MRTPLPLPDPADVLLDGVAVTRQARSVRTWPIGFAVRGGRSLGVADGAGRLPRSPTAADAASSGDHELIRIGDDGIAQLDLRPEDDPEAGLFVGRRPTDDAVEPLVVRDAEPGKPQLERPIGELVRRRRTVEEREARVAMELGVGVHRDG